MDTSEDHASKAKNTIPKEDLASSISLEECDSWMLLNKNSETLDKKPSCVEIIKSEETRQSCGDIHLLTKEDISKRRQRHDSQRSIDSQLDESSDGISVISESDATNCEKCLAAEDHNYDHTGTAVHIKERIKFKLPLYEPPTPPYTPNEKDVQRKDEEKEKEDTKDIIANAKCNVSSGELKLIEKVQPAIENHHALTRWIMFSIIATAMAAIIVGNAMSLQNRMDEINFEHEKRISELELENNILKNEMNKLRHLYTRSELDEQVQRAEFEWKETLQPQATESVVDAVDGDKWFDEVNSNSEPSNRQPVRKVPPQDSDVIRRVVWSGDEEEPMLVVDKEYVLPAFCYNQEHAVHDDLFFEYSTKYCDVRKRKIEAKQNKAKNQGKYHPKKENYNKFINQIPKTAETPEHAAPDPSRMASPFNIDYRQALDAIKSEGSVIVEALGNILDFSTEPATDSRSEVFDSVSNVVDSKFMKHQNEANEQNVHTEPELAQDVTMEKINQNQAQIDPSPRINTINQEEVYGNNNKNPRYHEDNKSNKQKVKDDYMDKKQPDGVRNGAKSNGNFKMHPQSQRNDNKDKATSNEFNVSDDRGHNKQKSHYSGRGTYLEHYKQDERTRGNKDPKTRNDWHETRHIVEQEHHDQRYKEKEEYYRDTAQKQKKRYDKHNEQKQHERHEKHYKNKEDYRRDRERKPKQYEKRYEGRVEYQHNDGEKHNEWHGKRYEGMEEFRQNNYQKLQEFQDKHFKGNEEYRHNGGKHRGRN